MIVDHIGIVVRSLERGLRDWEALFGYRQNSAIVENTRQRVRVVFLTRTDSVTVKLVEPLDDASSVAAFAGRGGGLHHICFRCADIPREIDVLKLGGARLLVPPQSGEAFCNHDIAFLFAPGNLNVELIDTDEKLGWGEPGKSIEISSLSH